ncbi:MAG: CRISPR-associated endonuclease Cas1, partial [Clostridia bacterium]
MRKLLNTLYVTSENAYLSLDGENIVLLLDGKEIARLPFTNIESIFCFNYLGCSPALMGKCADSQVGLCFLTPTGRFLARVTGEIKGNVFLRKQQFNVFEDEVARVKLTQDLIVAKLKNTRNLLNRSKRDYPEIDKEGAISSCMHILTNNIDKVQNEKDLDIIRGFEGQSAKAYFDVFDNLILHQQSEFRLYSRTKRPPLDRINAMLSFLYTVCTNDI